MVQIDSTADFGDATADYGGLTQPGVASFYSAAAALVGACRDAAISPNAA
jgi:hypothetical protein